MRNLNRIVLTGGLTRDPELRHTRAGTPVTTLRIAYTTQRKVGGAWEERSNYIDVELWGAQADSAARHLHKGRQVAIDGRLEWRAYETREGDKRQTHTIVADAVEFLGAPSPAGLAADESPSRSADDADGDDDIPF